MDEIKVRNRLKEAAIGILNLGLWVDGMFENDLIYEMLKQAGYNCSFENGTTAIQALNELYEERKIMKSYIGKGKFRQYKFTLIVD